MEALFQSVEAGMGQAALGGGACSTLEGDRGEAGDPRLEGDYREDKGALPAPSQPWELLL